MDLPQNSARMKIFKMDHKQFGVEDSETDLPYNAGSEIYENERKSDRELTGRLMLYDEAAWQQVVEELLTPLSRKRKYVETLARYGLKPEVLLTECFDLLHKDNFARLRNFRFQCSLKSYLYNVVRDAYRSIHSAHKEKKRKISLVLSELSFEFAPSNMKSSYQRLADADDRTEFNQRFAALWDENPVYALTLLMRNHLESSSNQVAYLLGKSAGHIDQINRRAKKRLYENRNEKNGRET